MTRNFEHTKLGMRGFVFLGLIAGFSPVVYAEHSDPGASAEPGFLPTRGERVLWYVPNRAMDLLDIFRIRFRAGPGWAANFRITDFGSFFIGQYDSLYIGLPGPRSSMAPRRPVGRESLSGVVITGVDATDGTPYGPEYGVSETNVGLHLGFLGIELGIDTLEIGDFLSGFFFRDPRGDDYPGKPKSRPVRSSAISLKAGSGALAVDPKPERFSSMTERLDYLYPNVHRRMSQPLRAADAYFALDPETPIEPPQMQFRLRLFGTIRQGQAMDFKFSPDLKIDVEMPNLEERFRLFVETARASDLPARYASELTDRGLNIGARKWFEELGVSADAGVRARWVPEAFIRVVWSRKWVAGEWGIRPEQRVFLESDDGLGTLSSVFLSRWLGARQEAVLLQNTSVKWTTRTEAWDWAASVDWARIESLLDESQRGRSVGWGDTARAWGARYAVFGQEGDLETHRATLRVRVPLYQRWIFLEADPGVEWYRGGSDGLIGVVRLGLDMLFWGHAVGSR